MDTAATSALSTPSSTASPGRWRSWLGYFGGAVLGLVLLVAAGAKALDPEGFAEQIRAEKLDSLLSAPTVALIGLGIEVAVGLALLLNLRRLWVLIPSIFLVGFLIFLTARTYVRTLHGEAPTEASCGCFGNLVQRTPAEAFWQDLLMLLPPLALAFVGRPRGGTFPRGRVAAVVLATSSAVAFGAKAAEMPLDDLATRLKPGVAMGSICAGGGKEQVCLDHLVPGLAEGDHLVVLADLESDRFTAMVPDLNRYSLGGEAQKGGETAKLDVLSASSAETKTAFFWKFGPAFEIHEAPPGLLRPLYRRLPRAFSARDGKVLETYSTVEEIRAVLSASSEPPRSQTSSLASTTRKVTPL